MVSTSCWLSGRATSSRRSGPEMARRTRPSSVVGGALEVHAATPTYGRSSRIDLFGSMPEHRQHGSRRDDRHLVRGQNVLSSTYQSRKRQKVKLSRQVQRSIHLLLLYSGIPPSSSSKRCWPNAKGSFSPSSELDLYSVRVLVQKISWWQSVSVDAIARHGKRVRVRIAEHVLDEKLRSAQVVLKLVQLSPEPAADRLTPDRFQAVVRCCRSLRECEPWTPHRRCPAIARFSFVSSCSAALGSCGTTISWCERPCASTRPRARSIARKASSARP